MRDLLYGRWDLFKKDLTTDLFPEGVFRRGEYLFRGQAKAEWPLRASFDRRFERLPPRNRDAVATQMVTAFHEECRRAGEAPGNWSHDEVVQLAQHYGLPTRLLDWSASPYVAAFFAFSDVLALGTRGEMVIWCLNTKSDAWGRAGVRLFQANHGADARMRNQRGWFSYIQGEATSLEELIPEHPPEPSPLLRIVMPATEAGCALADLDMMGLNHSALFPGWIGYAKTAEVRTMLENCAPE